MVNKLAEIEPRSSTSTTVTNTDTGEDFFRPAQLRDTFILTNDLDEYAEVTLEATHSQDSGFSDSLTVQEGIPLRPGDTRQVAYRDPNELVQFVVHTPTAPSSGSLTIWREKDNTPTRLSSNILNEFKELDEGRTYTSDFQASIADGSSITAGIRNPESADVELFIGKFGPSVGGDALVTTEIDHDSYTDGSDVTVINKNPEFQIERPLGASLSQDPTISGAQKSMTGFLPGGTTGANRVGNRFSRPNYKLSPGQDITIELQNDSGASGRFGFSLEVIETVVR